MAEEKDKTVAVYSLLGDFLVILNAEKHFFDRMKMPPPQNNQEFLFLCRARQGLVSNLINFYGKLEAFVKKYHGSLLEMDPEVLKVLTLTLPALVTNLDFLKAHSENLWLMLHGVPRVLCNFMEKRFVEQVNYQYFTMSLLLRIMVYAAGRDLFFNVIQSDK